MARGLEGAALHHVRVYGLGLAVDAPVSGLARRDAEDAKPDVEVRLTGLPEDLGERSADGERPWPAGGGDDPRLALLDDGRLVRMAWPGGVEFVMTREGTRVWGRGDEPAHLAPYLLGPVLGFLLRLRGETCLHASAVVVEGRGVALAGSSGVGKSTVAAVLARGGHPVLADDVLVLDVDRAGRARAVPGYPRLLLWPDAVAFLDGSPDARPRVSARWEKRYVDLESEPFAFHAEPAPLGAVYLLEPEVDAPGVEVRAVPPAEAVPLLAANGYASAWLDAPMRARDFDRLARIVECVAVRRLRFDDELIGPYDRARALLEDVREATR